MPTNSMPGVSRRARLALPPPGSRLPPPGENGSQVSSLVTPTQYAANPGPQLAVPAAPERSGASTGAPDTAQLPGPDSDGVHEWPLTVLIHGTKVSHILPEMAEVVATPEVRACNIGRKRARDVTFSKWLESESPELAKSVRECSAIIGLRNYVDHGETRVRYVLPGFCRRRFLCSLCDSMRASKTLGRYVERVMAARKANGYLRCYLVTLTVRNGDSLEERFGHLVRSHRAMMDRRRRLVSSRGRSKIWTESAAAAGGVYSIEVKRGRGSKKWHPHLHAVWMCGVQPDQQELAREWKAITGDSHQVDVQLFRSMEGLEDWVQPTNDRLAKDLCEVVKYSLKFSEMEFGDQWEAFQTLRRKRRAARMVGSFGCLRGLVEADVACDDRRALDDDANRFIDSMWAWCSEESVYEKAWQWDATSESWPGESELVASKGSRQ